MKYVIKLTLERDGEPETEWAIGCLLSDNPTEKELATARRELFKSVQDQVRRLLEDDLSL